LRCGSLGVSTARWRNKTTSEKSRTALRTVETSSYAYFGVVRRSLSSSKLFKVLVSWPLTRYRFAVRVRTGLPMPTVALTSVELAKGLMKRKTFSTVVRSRMVCQQNPFLAGSASLTSESVLHFSTRAGWRRVFLPWDINLGNLVRRASRKLRRNEGGTNHMPR